MTTQEAFEELRNNVTDLADQTEEILFMIIDFFMEHPITTMLVLWSLWALMMVHIIGEFS